VKIMRHVRIFVASPMEPRNELETIRTIVSEINLTAGPLLGLWVEVLSWETHAFPAVGPDGQSTINTQIGDEYDIFLGLIWARIGTATPRAESGTIEEFNRALDRLKRDGNHPHIMFYFLDSPLPPSRIEGDQLQKVHLFQRRLRELGVLYWTVGSTDEFARVLRVHLTKTLEKQAAEKTTGGSETSGDKGKLLLERDYADICNMDLKTGECWDRFSTKTKDFYDMSCLLDKGTDLRYKLEFCRALPRVVDELLQAIVQVEAAERELLRAASGLLEEEYGVIADTTKKEVLAKVKFLIREPTNEMAALLARLEPTLMLAEDIAVYMTALASETENGVSSIIKAKNSFLAMFKRTQEMLKTAIFNREILMDRCDAALRRSRLARDASST
jgi:hypothetical protein